MTVTIDDTLACKSYKTYDSAVTAARKVEHELPSLQAHVVIEARADGRYQPAFHLKEDDLCGFGALLARNGFVIRN